MAQLGVQIIGNPAPLKAALGGALAATEKWAADTTGATVKVTDAFAGVTTATLRQAVATDKLAISYGRYGAGSLGAAQAALRYRREVEALSTSQVAAMRGVGRGLSTYVSLPLAVLGYEAVKAGVTFQTEMLRIQTQAGASAGEVQRLSKAVLGMAGSVGVAPDKLAQGLFHLESVGLRGAKAIDALRVAAIAAGASGANLEDVTTALGGAIVTGIRGVQNYHQAMAGLVAIAGEGNMRMQDLTAALGTGVLPAAKNAGVSLREVGAALAVLADRGMSAEMSGTRLRMTFALMQHQSAAAKKALADMGIGSDELSTMLRKPNGLLGVLQLLHDRMAAVGANRGSRDILGAFGGGRSGAGILTLIQSLDSSVSSYQQKLVGYDQGVAKAAHNMAVYQQSEAFKLHQASASLQADLVKIGGSLAPVAVKMGQIVAGVANDFSKLPGPVKHDVEIIAGLLGVGGPLLLAVASATRAIQTIGTAFRRLPAEAAPGLAATGAEIDTSIGGAVVATEAKVLSLRTMLLGLGALAIAPIVIPLVVEGGQALSKWLGANVAHGFGDTKYSPEQIASLKNDLAAGKLTPQDKAIYEAVTGHRPPSTSDVTSGTGEHGALRTNQARRTRPTPTPTPKVSAPSPYTLDQAQQLDLALASNPNSRAAIEAKIRYDEETAAWYGRRIAEGKGSKAIYDALISTLNDEKSLESQLTAQDTKTKKAAASEAKKRMEAAKKAAAAEAAADKKAAELLKQQVAQAAQTALSAFGALGQGPVITGPAGQFVSQYGGGFGPATYLADLRQQNANMRRFVRNLETLRKRGASKDLIDTLLGQGQAGAAEARALVSAPRPELKSFFKQFMERQQLAISAARLEVKAPKVEIAAAVVNVDRTHHTSRPTANKFGRVGHSGRRH